MKFASIQIDGRPRWGLVDGPALHPLPADAPWADLRAALATGALAAAAELARRAPALPLEGLDFAPVIPLPGKILCVGINYLPHIREMGRGVPDFPVLFVRFPDSFTGHGHHLVRPAASTEYDYEGELAIVIGRPARHVPAARALDYVAGYTCLMDGSARDWQRHTSQFTAGKNFPRSGSMGPWLATVDEIPDPAALTLSTRINGEVMQQAPVADLCFDVPHIVEYCSRFCQLEPGDIISTGTPGGVGFARTPPRWLTPGDTIEVEISGIGVLRNGVKAE